MRRFGEQNGSFWSVKWRILKMKTEIGVFLNGFFADSKVFVSLEREKICARFFD
jgi:hypothetical protein